MNAGIQIFKTEDKEKVLETPERIKSERDAMKWFIQSLDERIVTNGKCLPHEALRYIKAGLFDLHYTLKSIVDEHVVI